MKNLTEKQQKQYDELTPYEKIIYNAIMRSFPATAHETAIDKAWQGGVRFQFIQNNYGNAN